MVRSVTVRVPAKVNVQLVVGGVRPDGFHPLANVFLAVGLYDEVTATEADELRITVSGTDADRVPRDHGNLAARAAVALGARYGVEPRVHLHIAKDIPVAGGMAGGSADGAGALVACDALWSTGAPPDALHALAAELGSDVPFPLLGGAALGLGRGEILQPLDVAAPLHWVFGVAADGLSTPEVFRACDRLRERRGLGSGVDDLPEPQPSAALLEALRTGDPWRLGPHLDAANDLQPAALSLRPELAETLRAGVAGGALAGLVSGSGPTCAFLTEDGKAARAVAGALAASDTCRTVRIATGPVPGAVVVD